MIRKKISVIIPCHAFNESLKVCLDSLMRFADSFDELILVADGFQLESSSLKAWNFKHLKVVENTLVKGPAHARNVGTFEATGDFLFFLDSDVEVVGNIFDKARRLFNATNPPDAIIGSYDNDPAAKTLVSRYRNLLHHYVHQHSDKQVATFWGACGIIKADVFHEARGFDTRFLQASVEDIALGYRLSAKGFRIQLCPEMQVKHLKKWTFWSMLRTDIQLRARPWTRLQMEYRFLGDKQLNVSPGERWVALLILLNFVTLSMSLIYPKLIGLFLGLSLLSIAIKLPFYRFMAKHQSKSAIPMIIGLHWMYYLSAITGFLLGRWDHLRFRAGTSRKQTQIDE